MAVKHCSKCNEDNVYSTNICSNCGNSLTNAEVLGTKSKEFVVNNYCTNCNEKIKPGTRNCPNCGEFLSKTTMTTSSSSKFSQYNNSNITEGTKILLYIITFLFPIIGLILGGVYIVSDDYEKHDLGKTLMILGIIVSIVAIVIWSIIFNF